MFMSAHARSSSNKCGVRRRLTLASILPLAASRPNRLRSFVWDTPLIPDFCCVMLCALSTTKACCASRGCSRGNRRTREQESRVWGRQLTTDSDNGQAATIYSKFRNRVMFPIANEQGKVIAFTGRTLANDEKAGPKY